MAPRRGEGSGGGGRGRGLPRAILSSTRNARGLLAATLVMTKTRKVESEMKTTKEASPAMARKMARPMIEDEKGRDGSSSLTAVQPYNNWGSEPWALRVSRGPACEAKRLEIGRPHRRGKDEPMESMPDRAKSLVGLIAGQPGGFLLGQTNKHIGLKFGGEWNDVDHTSQKSLGAALVSDSTSSGKWNRAIEWE
ncbi:unnamed protein product [Linum trigynum]|uniref:Uncharacterized protein n=1 Tax=Linum trigynum TaxID=586398 RepID=A0AAV2CDF6_9ROSI